MTVNTPGNYLTERVDRGTVLPAGVATFEERRKTKDMIGGLAEDKEDVAVGLNKNKSRGSDAETLPKAEKPRMTTNI